MAALLESAVANSTLSLSVCVLMAGVGWCLFFEFSYVCPEQINDRSKR
jgi:hypothetical protein